MGRSKSDLLESQCRHLPNISATSPISIPKFRSWCTHCHWLLWLLHCHPLPIHIFAPQECPVLGVFKLILPGMALKLRAEMSLSLQQVWWVGQVWLSKDTWHFSPFPDTFRPGVCRSFPWAKHRAENASMRTGNRNGGCSGTKTGYSSHEQTSLTACALCAVWNDSPTFFIMLKQMKSLQFNALKPGNY